MTCLASAGLRLAALRDIPGLRLDIATRINRAAFGVDAGSDLAEAIEMLSEWLDEGEARLTDALRLADGEARDADEEWAERRIVPHSVAAE